MFAETKELIKNCKTFEEIQQVLVEWNKRLLHRYNDDIQLTERNIAAKIAQIDDYIREHGDIGAVAEEDINYEESYDDDLTEWRAQLGVLRKSLTITKKHAENDGMTYNYIKYTMENLKENIENECCPICLDDIEKDQLTITKCGHRFCLNCTRHHALCRTHGVQRRLLEHRNPHLRSKKTKN